MGLAVAFGFEKVEDSRIKIRSEFRFQNFEGAHGLFQNFSPGGILRFRPTLPDDLKIMI